MRKATNKDGSPRKLRSDCKVFRLPDEGQVEFADVIQHNPASPNIEQLEAVLAKHGVKWARQNIYEFLKSARQQEFLIAAGVLRNRLLGQTLADAGADQLHADSRRLAIGYWMTILRAAQDNADTDPITIELNRKAAAEATDKLVALGALKGIEDKGALNLAKLEIEREKVSQTERKLALLEAERREARAVVTSPALSPAEKEAEMKRLLGVAA